MFYVYMLTSKPYGTIYVGMTSDLLKPMWEHKNGLAPGFTTRYGVDRLVCSKHIIRTQRRCGARSRSRSGGGIGRST